MSWKLVRRKKKSRFNAPVRATSCFGNKIKRKKINKVIFLLREGQSCLSRSSWQLPIVRLNH